MASLAGFANIGKVPELRRRVIFTLMMLAVYRIGAFVTIPGVDRNVMKAVVNKQGGGLLGFFNMFSGGALEVFAAGAKVDAEALASKGLLKGRWDKIKILGDGELTKAVTVTAHAFSKSAAEKIKKAGGKAVLLDGGAQ